MAKLALREGRTPGDRPAAAAAARPVRAAARRGPGRRAIGVGIESLFGSSEALHEDNLLRGLAASGGVYEGLRAASGPDEFDRIVHGDVLVTEATTEAFNILLPLLGAIVTDSGGLLSHSAIVAREYGIPGSSVRGRRRTGFPTGPPCAWTATPAR